MWNVDEKTVERDMIKAMTIHWEDEAVDKVELQRIFDNENPDGVMKGLLEIPEEIPEKLDELLAIGPTPTIVRWMDYFENKYGAEKGRLLFMQFGNRCIFNTPLLN